MPMQFNYDFDMAALFIFFTIFLLNTQQNFLKNKNYYLFIWLWLTCIVVAVTDIGAVHCMEYNSTILFYVTSNFHYIGIQFVAYIFCCYTVTPVNKKKNTTFWRTFVFTTPLLLMTAIIISNPWTKLIYAYDFVNKAYYYGPLVGLCYVVAFIYVIDAMWYCYKKKKLYNESSRLAFINAGIIVGIFLIYALIRQDILTKAFSFALAMIQLYIMMMNEHPRKSFLTGMLDRKYFLERTKVLMLNKESFSVVCIRVLDYEMLLNAYGVENIQLLEKEVCTKIKTYVPKNCGYKLGEDTIALLIEDQTDELIDVYEKNIDSVLRQKWAVNGMDISFSHTSIKIKAFEDFENDTDLYNLIQHIQKDSKMNQGINKIDSLEINKIKREHEVEVVLKDAIERKAFEMYYQPIYSCHKKKFATAEALIRLKNNDLGYIGPAEFIPIAEKIGLIVQLGNWILEDTFKFVAENDLTLWGVDYVEVNLSTVQCLQRDLVTTLYRLKEKYRVEPKRICFEITETAGNNAPETFTMNLNAIKDAGYKLAIDDFGTGYGNLERLFNTEFDIVKYDKETTVKMCNEVKLHGITGRMSTMLHAMKSKIVAEGVEEKEQYEFLEIMGIDYIQGFYFSKPLCEKDYIEFLRKNN